MNLHFILALLLAAVSNYLALVSAEKVILCVPNLRERSCDGLAECSRNDTVKMRDLSFRREDSLDIYLCSTEYNTIDVSNITLANLQSINITGNGSTINCQNNQFGFYFQNVSRVAIRDITLHQCGFDIEEDLTGFGNFTAGIYIADSSNISLSNVRIQSTPGFGLILLRNDGYITITDSHFSENHDSNFKEPGGGALIVTSSSQSSNYNINNCVFVSNGALRKSTMNHDAVNDLEEIDFSRGGGVNAYFQNHTAGISMNIVDSTFENNSAAYGGAVYLFIKDSAQNVNVALSQSQFRNNTAFERGGGLAAGYLHGSKTNTLIQVFLCNFTNNTAAEYGGGTYVYANPMQGYNTQHSSGITFTNTNWTGNTAMYGSAVYASPYTARRFYEYGHFPAVLFQNCWLNANKHHSKIDGLLVLQGRGTIYSHTINIWLKGEVSFVKNKNSGLHLFSSILEVESNSTILFKNNTAYQGGAIHMEGFSSIYLNDNSNISFDSNIAFDKGTAIYHETPVDPTLFSVKNCFVNYIGDYEKPVEERNINLEFFSNLYSLNKQFIYLFSAKPCYRIHQYDIMKALSNTANFHFNTNETAISTAPSNFTVEENLPKTLIPGIEKKIAISVIDDTNSSTIPPVYEVEVRPIDNSTINVVPLYATVNDNKINLYGNVSSRGSVKLNLNTNKNMYLMFNVTLQDCPPGYVEKTEAKQRKCYCSAYTEHMQYVGIKRCDDTSNQAKLTHRYWAGYIYNNTLANNFRVANCPEGYCGRNTQQNPLEVSLPHSVHELNDAVCSENRHGIICALCKNGTSVFYRAQPAFLCREETYCNFGIFLYIISQIIPVTILFLIVILFDIQLTTGALNGFILYTQIDDSLSLTGGNNFITFPSATKLFLKILDFIVSMFNLKFFNAQPFSFCVFKGATSLDVIAFDYITIVYSLFLIILTVLVTNMRCCQVSKLFKKLNRNKLLLSQSIVHGLSGFLIMCYARATTITLKLLTPVWLFGKGPQQIEKVVYYYGEMLFFGPSHLKYAIPAVFALVLITILPPVLLLVYPLCYKVLALMKLEETRVTRVLCRVVPLERFKPFFDSFQGAFKDNHRYFAGLYFIYRLIPLVLHAVLSNKLDIFFYFEIQLILMLGLHAYVQPYKENRHNKYDLYIFLLLLTINRITSYNYQWTAHQLDSHNRIQVFSTIQVLLAYIPVLFMAIWLLVKLWKKIKCKCSWKRLQNVEEENDDFTLSLSELDQRLESRYNNF